MTDQHRKPNELAAWGIPGLCLSIPPSLLFWGMHFDGAWVGIARIFFPLVALLSVILLIRPGKPLDEHDYLSRCFGSRKFFRDGFQFAFAMSAPNGICCIELWYQNSRSAPCRASVGIVPVSSFLQRKQGELIVFNVECEPGEFGVVRYPFPDANKHAGQRTEFHAGASVNYHRGMGEDLGFTGGILIARDAGVSGTAYVGAITAVALTVGVLALKSPARIQFVVPGDVLPDPLPGDSNPIQHEVLWKVDEPSLSFDCDLQQRCKIATLKQ